VSLSNILLIPGVGGDLQELRGLLFGNGQASDLSVALSSAKWNTPDFSVFPFSYVKLVGNAGGVIELVSKG